jgi:hypothetical protein
MFYGTAEAVPYKDLEVATSTLSLCAFGMSKIKPHKLKHVPLKPSHLQSSHNVIASLERRWAM